MIKINTIPNVVYSVSCDGSCRVTAPADDGGEMLLLEFDDAGGRGRFVAPENLVWLDNANAVVHGLAMQNQDSAAAAIVAAAAAEKTAAAAVQAATAAQHAAGVPLSYLLSQRASNATEWNAIATRLVGCSNKNEAVFRSATAQKIIEGKLCYPQYTKDGAWILGQSWRGDEFKNFETTTLDAVIDASSVTRSYVFLYFCFSGAFRRVFIFAPNLETNVGASMNNMEWIHELDGVFTKLKEPERMFAFKTRTHSMPWCAGKTLTAMSNANYFMCGNVALPADQFPVALPNVTRAQEAFKNCKLLTQDVADAILNSLPTVKSGSVGQGTITFTGTAAATAWAAEGADLTAVEAAMAKGWTVEY